MLKRILRSIPGGLWLTCKFYLYAFIIFCIASEGVYAYYQVKHGNEPIVAIVDSGIQPTHSIFKNRIVHPFDMLKFDKNPEDKLGHGTFIAGIIAEQAPHSKIMPVKALGTKSEKEGAFSTSFAIYYSVLHGADVINMSFIQSDDILTKLAIRYGQLKGVIFVAATGNEGKHKIHYPANISGVIQVAGMDGNGSYFKESNWSSKTYFAAPGVNISGINIHGKGKKNRYTIKSGTSLSAAYISGAIARLKEIHPNWKQPRIEKELKRLSYPVIQTPKSLHQTLYGFYPEKLESLNNQKLYLKAFPKTPVTQSASTTVHVDSMFEDKIGVNDSRGFRWLSKGQQQFKTDLEEGNNLITISARQGNKTIQEKVEVVRDTKPPTISYNRVTKGKDQISYYVFVQDHSLRSFRVNKREIDLDVAKQISDSSGREATLYIFEVNAKSTPFNVTATDKMGHKTTETIDNWN
ncbi:hypothetical protein CN918_25900 [Priestia megaterium]|nr:hypothetical protein CN918_25900 [Priestia megaterium]